MNSEHIYWYPCFCCTANRLNLSSSDRSDSQNLENSSSYSTSWKKKQTTKRRIFVSQELRIILWKLLHKWIFSWRVAMHFTDANWSILMNEKRYSRIKLNEERRNTTKRKRGVCNELKLKKNNNSKTIEYFGTEQNISTTKYMITYEINNLVNRVYSK